MSIQVDDPIWFEDREFYGAKEIGFDELGSFVLRLYTTPFVKEGENRGGYLTVLPISPKKYRMENKTKTKVVVNEHGKLFVYDDWGTPYGIFIENPVAVARLVLDLLENDVPVDDTEYRERKKV